MGKENKFTIRKINQLFKRINGSGLRCKDKFQPKLVLDIVDECPSWAYSTAIYAGAYIRSLIASGPYGWISTEFHSRGCTGQRREYSPNPKAQPINSDNWEIIKTSGKKYFINRACVNCSLRARCQE